MTCIAIARSKATKQPLSRPRNYGLLRSSVGAFAPTRWLAMTRLVRLHQRAAALVERAERFVAGHGGEQLVEIPFALGLFRLLDLEQIHVVHHAAVDADLAVLGKEVVDRGCPHL